MVCSQPVAGNSQRSVDSMPSNQRCGSVLFAAPAAFATTVTGSFAGVIPSPLSASVRTPAADPAGTVTSKPTVPSAPAFGIPATGVPARSATSCCPSRSPPTRTASGAPGTASGFAEDRILRSTAFGADSAMSTLSIIQNQLLALCRYAQPTSTLVAVLGTSKVTDSLVLSAFAPYDLTSTGAPPSTRTRSCEGGFCPCL